MRVCAWLCVSPGKAHDMGFIRKVEPHCLLMQQMAQLWNRGKTKATKHQQSLSRWAGMNTGMNPRVHGVKTRGQVDQTFLLWKKTWKLSIFTNWNIEGDVSLCYLIHNNHMLSTCGRPVEAGWSLLFCVRSTYFRSFLYHFTLKWENDILFCSFTQNITVCYIILKGGQWHAKIIRYAYTVHMTCEKCLNGYAFSSVHY